MKTNEIKGISPKFVLFRTVKLFFYYRKSELSWFRIVHFCLFKFIFGVEVSSSSFLLLQEVLLNADTLTLSQRIRPRQECNKDKKTEQKVPEIYTQGTGSINSRWSTFRLTWLSQPGSIDSSQRILAVFDLICHQHDVGNLLVANIVFEFG